MKVATKKFKQGKFIISFEIKSRHFQFLCYCYSENLHSSHLFSNSTLAGDIVFYRSSTLSKSLNSGG